MPFKKIYTLFHMFTQFFIFKVIIWTHPFKFVMHPLFLTCIFPSFPDIYYPFYKLPIIVWLPSVFVTIIVLYDTDSWILFFYNLFFFNFLILVHLTVCYLHILYIKIWLLCRLIYRAHTVKYMVLIVVWLNLLLHLPLLVLLKYR